MYRWLRRLLASRPSPSPDPLDQRSEPIGPVDFDEAFYVARYPDLKKLGGRNELIAHYQRHGRQEGRFTSLAHARKHFEQLGNTLPTDFNPRLYRQLNPDLQRLYREDWEYELHFLGHGRGEGRPYGAEDTRARRAWTSIFNLHDFLLFSTPWCPPTQLNLKEALALFEAKGIERIVPIARDWFFEPSFYKAHYGIDSETPVQLYRHWLDYGFAAGLAPNERRAIHSLLGGQDYPACFDWMRYRATSPETPNYPTKIEALRDLFEEFDTEADCCISGVGSADLYLAIGDFHLIRAAFEKASEAYSRALELGDGGARLHQSQGDALRGLGRNGAALGHYQQSMTFPSYSVWAVVNVATMSLDSGDHQAAFALLKAELKVWAASPAFRRAIDGCVEKRFVQIAEALRKMIEIGDVDGAGAYADTNLGHLTDTIRTLKVPDNVSITGDRDRVVMLACLDLPQCTHYRVKQKAEQLAARGIELDVFDFNDPAAFMQALPGASAAIFYRVPSYPKVVESILYARSLGIATFYDIDDLIFTADFPDTFRSYEDQISMEAYVGLRHGVPLYKHAISLCDVGLASTLPLAGKLQELVRERKAYVVANGLDSSHAVALQMGALPKVPGKTITLFYGSGTKAHNRDFNAVVGPALLELMAKHPDLRLVIAGYLDLDRKFERFKDRVERFCFIEELTQYWSLLASCDINISVLAPGVMADCKSEIKWLEAAILQIPSVVSRTATFEGVIDAPHDGLLASNTREWIEHLSSLVDSPGVRRSIGAAARAKALRLYALEKVGEDLVDALVAHVEPRQSRSGTVAHLPVAAKTRILVCNVFFAPQTHGGATRVVEANVDYFLEHFASTFELFILATDDGMPPGRLKIDSYKGCQVFRIATPVEKNMDWRPFNEDNGLLFKRVLDIVHPHLVHFHCVQRLTATIVEETLKRGIPYVVTVHDGWWISDYQFLVDQNDSLISLVDDGPPEMLPDGVTRLQSVERRQRLKALLSAARYTLPVSRSFADLYRGAGIANVRAIPNGLTKLPPRLETGERTGKLVLGHIGARSAHKGAALIEIAFRTSRFANLELVIIDGLLEFGVERRMVWGETDVCIRGQYPQTRVNELFASFDVLLAPSTWPESFGLVTREAAFYGKWIVASDRGAIAEDIDEGRDGFKIDVSDTRDLVRVLGLMNGEPDAYRHVASRTRCPRSADEQAIELARVYHSILEEASSAELGGLHPAKAAG